MEISGVLLSHSALCCELGTLLYGHRSICGHVGLWHELQQGLHAAFKQQQKDRKGDDYFAEPCSLVVFLPARHSTLLQEGDPMHGVQ